MPGPKQGVVNTIRHLRVPCWFQMVYFVGGFLRGVAHVVFVSCSWCFVVAQRSKAMSFRWYILFGRRLCSAAETAPLSAGVMLSSAHPPMLAVQYQAFLSADMTTFAIFGFVQSRRHSALSCPYTLKCHATRSNQIQPNPTQPNPTQPNPTQPNPHYS